MKELAKRISEVLFLLGLFLIMGGFTLNALDRSIYRGCRVLEQRGNTLLIELEEDLLTGTDTACQKAERLVEAINRDGYDAVIVVSSQDQWVPRVAPIAVK